MKPWTLSCACGATVTANSDDPQPGVSDHNSKEPHRSWSRRTSWAPPPEADPTATMPRVDLSAVQVVRPARLRRPRTKARRYCRGMVA